MVHDNQGSKVIWTIIRLSVIYVPLIISVFLASFPEQIQDFWRIALSDEPMPMLYRHCTVFFIVLIGIFVWGLVLHCRFEKQYKELNSKYAELSKDTEHLSDIFLHCGGVYLEEIWLIFLRILYEKHAFAHGERISLYCYNNGNDAHFIMLARHSVNPDLKSKGRGVYKADEGCIWLGWTQGKSCISSLPDYSKSQKQYLNSMSAAGKISKTTIKGLHMKPRSIGSFAIQGADNTNKAVIVVESNNPDIVTDSLINDMMDSAEIKNIKLVLTRFGDNLPKMNILRDKGL